MKNARFWTGVAMLMCPLTGILIANHADVLFTVPSVEGRITYQGRPVRGGIICLASADREHSSDMTSRIDENGRFTCRPALWDTKASPMRFEIRLYPDPRELRRAEEAGILVVGGESADQAEPLRAPAGAWGPEGIARIRMASIRSSQSIARPPALDSRPRYRILTPSLETLEVSIGSETVRLEIDLD